MLGALMRQTWGRQSRRSRGAGVTMVELMVTLGIVAVLMAIDLPSMRELIVRKRLEGTAQALMTDLRLLRSHQLQTRLDTGTGINFGTTDTKTCYIVYTRGNGGGGNPINCTCAAEAAKVCGDGGEGGIAPAPLRQVDIPVSSGVRLSANRRFLAMLGTNAMPQGNGTLEITVAGESAGSIRVSTNEAGLPSMCSVSGSFGSIAHCP